MDFHGEERSSAKVDRFFALASLKVRERSSTQLVNTLQTLLVILNGQKLLPGYLTPAGSGTALETVIALKKQFDPYTLASNPIPRPAALFTPARIAPQVAFGGGQEGIFLDDVDGNLNLGPPPPNAHIPAYVLALP